MAEFCQPNPKYKLLDCDLSDAKIDPQTQETRDNKSKQILLSELKTEEEALQAARKSGLADNMHLHQQNIELLNKEIRRIQ